MKLMSTGNNVEVKAKGDSEVFLRNHEDEENQGVALASARE